MVELAPEFLQSVSKPTRYTGGEWNASSKDPDSAGCTFALCLPDVYEVGMSNLGLAILYEILNRRKDTAAERVYAPWRDMEDMMREKGLPLFSLESRRPLSQFDFWGFSLQYEMIFSNVLNLLDLAHVPLCASERGEGDPFILGGGPCVYNVEPMADFFDFFVVGEGEEVLGEIVDAFLKWKKEGCPKGRKGFLERLLSVEGIYVPSFYAPEYDGHGRFRNLRPLHDAAKPVIYKRVVRDMDAAISAERPLVPYMDIVHNRMMLELFRGCSRGCRFCQAGICYRPVRERSRDRLKEIAREMVDATGYDEMSLTSLSSADYSCLERLVDELSEEFCKETVSFSLPSLRIDSFSIGLAHRMQQTRKSGLTFAPEAGTQRLRDVINKGVTEEDLMTACGSAFRQGWRQVKLYFMMGLPTETDEDIIGIGTLAKKVVDLYEEIKGRRGAKVTVSVSCFVPKPYTPFQWFGQISREEFQRRQKLLKEHIKDRAITFNYHDAGLSVLEGALARGDRRLAPVIHRAWKEGAKFDGWSDQFREDVWREAFRKCNINMEDYNLRTRDFEEALPWEITSPGVNREFLLREWQRAMEGKTTEDCRRGTCSSCGICPNLGVHVIDHGEEPAPRAESALHRKENAPQAVRYRGRICKGESLRFLSHLDYAAVFERAILRAKLPVVYSEGFHPHMKLSFASALSVGVTSEAEYMEFELTKPLCQPEVFDRLRKQLPKGAELMELKELRGKRKSLMAEAELSRYLVSLPYGGTEEKAMAALKSFNAAKEISYTRITPKKKQTKEVKAYLERPLSMEFQEGELRLFMEIRITESGSVKPGEILTLLRERYGLDIKEHQANIHRTALLGRGKTLLGDMG